MAAPNLENHAMRIAVIGGGPAGATVAALLAKKGASVVLIDDGMRPPLIVGESLVPQLVPVFRRLGIEEEVARIGVRKPGVTVTFGAEDEIQLSFQAVRGVLPTYAYNVPRREFDDLITRTALAAGVRIVKAAGKFEIEKGSLVRLAPETLAEVPEWAGGRPDFLIDASGRRRIFAKLLGIDAALGPRRDVAHFAHFENCPWPEPAGQVMTMRLEYGWGWRIPLPGPRLSIGVVINKDDAKRFGATPEEQLEGVINNDARLARECGTRRRLTPVATFANYQLISRQGVGPNWATVGDAFGFVDPMLSPGLCMAMVSAERLAGAIPVRAGCEASRAVRLRQYEKWFRHTLSAWQELVDYFYDGRIFAMQRTGVQMSGEFPGTFSKLMHRHVEKNLSGMASGAYVARPYSRWLLRTLGKRFVFGANPADFAIR
ncbi:MAG: NAD(P)/FAD-dependent oxidoreductase [Terrimicrobiaceae bacterium]|nr:NAD(P)/FAD-dependent oxidoreductase [Terrimicrobiaceae bacterium]